MVSQRNEGHRRGYFGEARHLGGLLQNYIWIWKTRVMH